jgi:dihydrofolate reductase
MSKGFTIIAGTTKENGIGLNGKLPWRNSIDMKYFKNITTQCMDNRKRNAVIMGRQTFKSMDYRPLDNRLNICITSIEPFTAFSLFMGKNRPMLESHNSLDFTSYSINYSIIFMSSLEDALKFLYKSNDIENVFVIGGVKIYEEAIQRKDCYELLINEIDCHIECDTFFPEIDKKKYRLVSNNIIGEGVCNKRYMRCDYRSNTM